MRFRVEVTPLGASGTASECFVEAEEWKTALARVRALRGEAEGEEGLSVELLDAGYRVIDTERMLRYVVETGLKQVNAVTNSRFDVLVSRGSEPSPALPLAYRERAVRLSGPASRETVQDVLARLLDHVRVELASHPLGKVVELGVFAEDAVELNSPLGTLSFRDWRGDTAELWLSDELPPDGEGAERAAPSVRPVAREAAQSSRPSARLSSRPPSTPPSSRRRSEENLVADLFDAMHALDFVPDVAAGVAFALDILERMLPSRISAIHVYDEDQRTFVLAGARGLADGALGSQLPENDAFFRWLRGQARARRFEGAQIGGSITRGHLRTSPPKRLMAAPVHFGGRTLGIVELGDPQGSAPYSEHEAAALDYVAERLGGFLAGRPVVPSEESAAANEDGALPGDGASN